MPVCGLVILRERYIVETFVYSYNVHMAIDRKAVVGLILQCQRDGCSLTLMLRVDHLALVTLDHLALVTQV